MNKPRLIDANELYKLIEENSYMLVDAFNSKDKGMFLIGIKEAIDKTPTAYDTDKIISYMDRVENSGMGKRKSLEYIKKFVKGGKADE